MYNSGYPPPREGAPPSTNTGAPPTSLAPPHTSLAPPSQVQYPGSAAPQPTYQQSYNFTQFPPPGLPGAGLPGVALPGYPVSSQHYPAPGGSTAPPLATSHASHQPFPPVSGSGTAPAYTTQMASSQGNNTSMYPQYPSALPAGYTVPGYPPGVLPPPSSTQPPSQWPHAQLQARATLMYPYPGSGPMNLPPSGQPQHYDGTSRTSRSPTRRDASPSRRDSSPSRRRSSKSPAHRSSRSPSSRRRDRSSTEWKRPSSYTRDRSTRRSEDGRRGRSPEDSRRGRSSERDDGRRGRSPERDESRRGRSPERDESRRGRSLERVDGRRGRSTDRDDSRRGRSPADGRRGRSPERDDNRRGRSPERDDNRRGRSPECKKGMRRPSLSSSSSTTRQRGTEKRGARSRQSVDARSPDKKFKKRLVDSDKKGLRQSNTRDRQSCDDRDRLGADDRSSRDRQADDRSSRDRQADDRSSRSDDRDRNERDRQPADSRQDRDRQSLDVRNERDRQATDSRQDRDRQGADSNKDRQKKGTVVRKDRDRSSVGGKKGTKKDYSSESSSTVSIKREIDPMLDDDVDTNKNEIKQEKEGKSDDTFNPDSLMSNEEIIAMEKKIWIRSTPADLYYARDPQNAFIMKSTDKGKQLHQNFKEKLIMPGVKGRDKNPSRNPPSLKHGHKHHHHHHGEEEEDQDSSDEDSDPDFKTESQRWLEFRAEEPNRLHKELWQNLPGELNDGPSCRCSKKARETGIRHNVWVGEEETPKPLDPTTNNFYDLYHYRITISPPTNFLVSIPTMINHDEHDFLFEGFSMFTRRPIPEFPVCKIIRFNIEYSILFFQERMPENFTINELDLFSKYFFHELLELWDWKLDQRFIFMPRFARDLTENGKELLSMNEVLIYLMNSYKPLINKQDLQFIQAMQSEKWEKYKAKVRGMLVTQPGKAPSTIRVDHIDRDHEDKRKTSFPEIVHFGLKPSQLCYAGNAEYQKQYRDFVKYRHLLANMPKPTAKDKQEYENMENRLMELRANTKMKRDTTVVVSSEGFHRTGLMADIVQHAMLLPVLVSHLRFHFSLEHMEEKISYTFNNRFLLQQALTHPGYKENFGTNPDHVRNTLSNCGIRHPEYGDKKVHSVNSRKRGINTLINIMSKMGRKDVTESKVKHNERLEYLGDAVVEFITSVHLFFLFPDLEEGGLATYRSAIVLNQNLADLALALGLEKYILFSHGPDLCMDAELRHAMANCFEAFLGAIFLDGGINVADKVFNTSMFEADQELFDVWGVLPLHPLQTQEPGGDRHWIEKFPHLKKLVQFEKETGIEFNHIRLLARAFTDRSVGINNLTLGSNQRLEFLGDSVLQLVTSEFLYKHFPDHHEGHLSLLRASLVNNRTQAVVCDDLGMNRFAVYSSVKSEVKVKDKADLLEAFIGALYVDKDLFYVQVFAQVCFFPRLYQFILNQDWNDPKSKLQQCCLTLRTMDGKAPDIPIYRVLECNGPSNTRVYMVAVYFRGQRLATAKGHSIQQAEFNSAEQALKDCSHLFPHLNYQKRVLMRSFKNQGIDYFKYKRLEEQKKRKTENNIPVNLTDENRKKESTQKSRKAKTTSKEKDDDRGARKSQSIDRRNSLERRSTESRYNNWEDGDRYYDRYTNRQSRDEDDRAAARTSFDGDRYYDPEEAPDRETGKRSSKGAKRRSEETRTRKEDLDRKSEDRRDRRSVDNNRTSIDTADKYGDGDSPLKETEMISEEEDNMEEENRIEDMVKDAVGISDDEISLSADNSSKKDFSDDGEIDDDDDHEEGSLKDFSEDGEMKDDDGEIKKDDGMKDLLNITEDISADEEEPEQDQVEIKTEKPEDITIETADGATITETEDIKVKIELSDLDKEVLTVVEEMDEEVSENIVPAEIKSEVTLPVDAETVSSDVKIEDEDTNKDNAVELEASKTIEPKGEVNPPLPNEDDENIADKEAHDMNNTKPTDEVAKAPQVEPPPTDLMESENTPTAEKSKSKKKKDKEKLKSERVKDEIEEIERKLAKKKAKAAKLAEKERKKKEKLKAAQKSAKEVKAKVNFKEEKSVEVEKHSEQQNAEVTLENEETISDKSTSNGDNLSEKVFTVEEKENDANETALKTDDQAAKSSSKSIEKAKEIVDDYQDLAKRNSVKEKSGNIKKLEVRKESEKIKKTEASKGSQDVKENEAPKDSQLIKQNEGDTTKESNMIKDTLEIKEEPTNSDLEEGECSDDEEEPDPTPPPPPQPPPPIPEPVTVRVKEEKVSSIKPFKIQKESRKDHHSSSKHDKTDKHDKDKHEKKELTEKEREREEKKKRWRKESPKKSHKDRDHRDSKRRMSSSSHHRSPSPRERSAKYYEFEERKYRDRPPPPSSSSAAGSYYDYPHSRSPPPPAYYDSYYERERGAGPSSSRTSRSPRAGSRRSARSPERSSSTRYRDPGPSGTSGYESSRETRDYRY